MIPRLVAFADFLPMCLNLFGLRLEIERQAFSKRSNLPLKVPKLVVDDKIEGSLIDSYFLFLRIVGYELDLNTFLGRHGFAPFSKNFELGGGLETKRLMGDAR